MFLIKIKKTNLKSNNLSILKKILNNSMKIINKINFLKIINVIFFQEVLYIYKTANKDIIYPPIIPNYIYQVLNLKIN